MTHKKSLLQSILMLALMGSTIAPTLAGTTYYRWEDERGNVFHSDRPPAIGIDYEVVKTESGLKRVVDGDEGAVPKDVYPSPGNEFNQVNEAEASRSKKNPELCERARTNLETLEGNAEVKIRDDQGEERFMTSEEIIVQREKARAQVMVYCP